VLSSARLKGQFGERIEWNSTVNLQSGTITVTAGTGEGEGEGGSSVPPLVLQDAFGTTDTDDDGRLSFAEAASTEIERPDFDAIDSNGDGLLQVSELLQASGDTGNLHRADQSGDCVLDLEELLRLIQLFNSDGYHCAANAGTTEDGYLTGGDGEARAHP
jgi:hypothetical protein